MLVRLQIENYALIDRVAIEFGPGLNVLTGETGSGKSIVVDALGLLLGDKADAGAIRSGSERAAVTGVFSFDGARRKQICEALEVAGLPAAEDDLIIRREIAVGGKGRVFIANEPATVAVLRQLAPHLGHIHSQNEGLVAFSPAAQLDLLDRFVAAEQNRRNGKEPKKFAELLAETAGLFETWRADQTRLEELERTDQLRLQEVDLWRFQRSELENARLRAGEDSELEQEHRRLANAARITAEAQAAYGTLYDSPEAVIAGLKSALRHIQDLARLDNSAEPLIARLESLRSELEDVSEQLRDWLEVDTSPERLHEVEDRIALLDRLKRKYGPTLAEVFAYSEQVAAKLDAVERSDEHIAEARAALARSAVSYKTAARAISDLRKQAAPRLARAIEKQVADLAMRVKFAVELQSEDAETGWSIRGWDKVCFGASTNPGEPLKPVHEIASGGELSRVLLALQVAIESGGAEQASARSNGKPSAHTRTLVFDEIDAGIGGRAAEAVGIKLRELSQSHQLLCVTHLPQIATFAQHHLRVEKAVRGTRTFTEVAVLNGSERVEEIARMLAGNQLNETSRKHAQELLRAHA